MKKNLRDFLNRYGIKTKEGDLKKLVNLERYKKEAKREKGLLELFFELIFKVFEAVAKEIKGKK